MGFHHQDRGQILRNFAAAPLSRSRFVPEILRNPLGWPRDPAETLCDRAAQPTAKLVQEWRRHGSEIETYEFPRELHLNHDVVDPEQIGGNPAVTYPRLLALIDP